MKYSPFLDALSFGSALLFALVRADNHGVIFLYPSSNGLTFNHLDTVNVTYSSPFPSPKLYTFCSNSANRSVVNEKLIVSVPPYNSSQLIKLDWPDLLSCHFDLRPNSSAGYGANSFSVKINNTARATPITFGINQPAETLSASPTLAPSNNGSGSSGKHIGIGVGVGGIAIALIGIVIFMRYRRKSKSTKATRGAQIPDYDSNSEQGGRGEVPKWQWTQGKNNYTSNPGQNVHMLPVAVKPFEMSSQTTYEMSADTVPHELSPDSSVGVPRAQDNKQQNRFSWEGRADSRD